MKNLKKSNKNILFENMHKLNPDFKLKEELGDIPRKLDYTEKAYQQKVEQIKKKLDQFLSDEEEWDTIDTLYRMLIYRKPQISRTKIAEHHSQPHEKKIELMKGKLDFLFQNDYYELIDKLDKIINKLYPSNSEEDYELSEDKSEEIYHETLSSALEFAKEKAEKAGYEIDEDDMFNTFGTGGVGYGETKSGIISLYKNGKPARKGLAISIYRMPSGKYELTSYVN